MEYISIPISVLSLAISLGTFWLVFVHRGRLLMTKPTIVFFGFDNVPNTTPKVFLRTLLYSTSNRGHVIEGMHVKVSRADSERVFSFWGYGEREKLTPGSGLHINRNGLSANHHFVLSVHDDSYQFDPGRYEIQVFANIVGRKYPVELATINLSLSEELASALGRNEGVLFERKISGEYEGHTRNNTPIPGSNHA